ncbi:MAG TPA: hypothetical protein VNO26_14330 [Candidatus Limnocylindria bacterium]|nr:hypothetical protein [Candidatus Limnocylindria bacterium]
MKEQLAPGAIERDKAELVDDQKLEPGEAPLQARQLAGGARVEEGAHEVGRTPEGDGAALAGGLDAERDREMGLARPARPGEQDVFCPLDPLAAGALEHAPGVDGIGPRRQLGGEHGFPAPHDRAQHRREAPGGFERRVRIDKPPPEIGEGGAQLGQQPMRELPDGLRLPRQLGQVMAVADGALAEADASRLCRHPYCAPSSAARSTPRGRSA